MLEKTLKALKNMDETFIKAEETKKKTFEYINANYKSKSELMNKKLEEMNRIYEETCEEATNTVREALEMEVDEAKEKIKMVACKEVPETFESDLAVIKARQGGMSDYEVELYVNKYLHNYPATAALNALLKKDYLMIRMMHVVNPEKLVEELEQRKSELLRLIKNYAPMGYVARIMRKDDNPVVDTALRIQSFVDGNFLMENSSWIAGKLPV